MRRDGSRADAALLMPSGDAIADMPDVNMRPKHRPVWPVGMHSGR